MDYIAYDPASGSQRELQAALENSDRATAPRIKDSIAAESFRMT
jgi:hypothetical protein